MKTNLGLLVIMLLIPVNYTSRASDIFTPPLTQTEQTLRYNFGYICNGEWVVISRCRKDSDQPGFPPTLPDKDYCQIYYPDRPKRDGFDASATELRGDLIKKLQACGALNTDRQKAQGDNQVQSGQNVGTVTTTKRPGSRFTGPTWEYRIDQTPAYAGPGSFAEPNKTQQLLNQRAAEGWQLIPFVGQRLLYFKRGR
ncbi:MAG: hypothetical protein ABI923_08690 [bacterium]